MQINKPLICLVFSLIVFQTKAQSEFEKYGPYGAQVFTDIKTAAAAEKQVFKLDLSYQNLDAKSLSRIQNFSNLQVLRLRNNAISVYPDNMEKLVNLMYFASYNNKLNSFLPKPQAYRSLHYLELQHCAIDSIPASIAYLSLLSSFHFGNSDDTLKLPVTLKYLKKLKDLSFENCVLDSFPKLLFQVSTLQFLYLSNTNTKLLSSHFERLPDLEVLIIENNPLEKIPFNIYKAQKLRVLSLRGNKLTRLPDSIAQLEHLSVLDLRGNPIPAEEIEKIRALLPGCEVKF
jgi:Leucine-rich repeat (LRR) protein